MSQALEEVASSEDGFRLQRTDERDTADLLILEIGEDPDKEFQRIQTMLSSGAIREIFVTSSRVEPELIIQAYREGVREFFSLPIKKEEVVKALLKFRERAPSVEKKKIGKIITVLGSKGGVGTTTIAVNLATSFTPTGWTSTGGADRYEPSFWRNPPFYGCEVHVRLGRNCRKCLPA